MQAYNQDFAKTGGLNPKSKLFVWKMSQLSKLMRKLVQLKRVTDGDVGAEPLAAEGHRDLWLKLP